MSSLDTIIVDVLNQRLKAGDAVVLHFHDDEEGHNWLIESVKLGTNTMSESYNYVCITYFVPGGADSFVIPVSELDTKVELVQSSKRCFQVNVDARVNTLTI